MRSLLRNLCVTLALGIGVFSVAANAQQLVGDQARAALVRFATAPFPYGGTSPESGEPFLNINAGGRLGHNTTRGGTYWADESYSDDQVLLYLSKGFRFDRPAVMVVYFHGNGATLEEDVIDRQQVVRQIAASGANAVLVAPQFAVKALDSSAGKFWQAGHFGRFLEEASEHLAELAGSSASARAFSRLPIVLVAYSGGYNPAAFALSVGAADDRIRGVVLLDAMFGEEARFASFIERSRRSAFFLSAYGSASADGNNELMTALRRRNIGFSSGEPKNLSPGYVGFIRSPGNHDDFVTDAWVQWPLAWVMARLVAAGL